MTTYDSAIDYLYSSLPAFEKGGAGQYKPGLETARRLSALFGNPHVGLKTVHIAGTNGKGTTAHTLAAILQSAGYKVGLYTSPHLVDFRERIRVNGEMIGRDEVADFVERYCSMPLDGLQPTFFELTTIMAFEHFRRSGVDIAVIETGLGGRLDTTNIISPEVSVITNISLDHTDLLGDSIEAIAGEKAGIIKPGVPAVVGDGGSGALEVFRSKAEEEEAELRVVDELEAATDGDGHWVYTTPFGKITGSLRGSWQPRNAAVIVAAAEVLAERGFAITPEAVAEGFADVERLTGLRGRWTVVGERPLRVYDTGHNPGAWERLGPQLAAAPGCKHVVLGFVADKDVDTILSHLSPDYTYYFTAPHAHRALGAERLREKAKRLGLNGETYADVDTAARAAIEAATPDDTVFIGGSNYLIAELDVRGLQ